MISFSGTEMWEKIWLNLGIDLQANRRLCDDFYENIFIDIQMLASTVWMNPNGWDIFHNSAPFIFYSIFIFMECALIDRICGQWPWIHLIELSWTISNPNKRLHSEYLVEYSLVKSDENWNV